MSSVSREDIDRAVEWVRTTKACGNFRLLDAYPDPQSPTTICVKFDDDEDKGILFPVHLGELGLPGDRPPSALANVELLGRIMQDLNYMIDVRGNQQLIPALVLVKQSRDEFEGLRRTARAMEAADNEEPHICYMGHEDCWDLHTSERLADESDWEAERERGH